MNSYIITIDGGTTNTRCVLWDNQRHKIDETKRSVGVRNTAIDKNNLRLKAAVKESLEQLLSNQSITYDSIGCIIASGMLTSDVGITEISHLVAPAGLKELANATVKQTLTDICPMPIHFVPGIKNTSSEITVQNYESMDIMRGEEVESLSIIHALHTGNEMLLVLPGSHNKFVSVDSQQRIAGCLTSISGELLSAITNDTIIAKSVNKNFVNASTYQKDWVLLGYENAKKVGIGRACFSSRILNLFQEPDTQKIANYILGASLQSDLLALLNTSALSIGKETEAVVCGKDPFKQALIDLFEHERLFSKIKTYQPPLQYSASSFGAYLIAEQLHLI